MITTVKYGFGYDGIGNQTSVTVGNGSALKTLMSNSYDSIAEKSALMSEINSLLDRPARRALFSANGDDSILL